MTQLEAMLADILRERAAALPLASGSPSSARRRAAQRTHRTQMALGAGAVAVFGGGAVMALSFNSQSLDHMTPGTDPATSPTTTTAASTVDSTVQSVRAMIDLKQQLVGLHFDPGPIDATSNTSTEQALWAAEGLLLGRTPEQKTGVVDEELWLALESDPSIRPRRTMPGTHVEIYLDLQVAVVFTDNVLTLITHLSSGQLNPDGNPTTFCEEVTYDTDVDGNPLPEPVTKGICAESKTPGGVFEISRMYQGDRTGPLGGMSNPVYFNYGIAIHGAVDVPKFPASHGGVRIPMHIAEYFQSLVEVGDAVLVWDGHKEPEEQTNDDMLPVFLRPA